MCEKVSFPPMETLTFDPVSRPKFSAFFWWGSEKEQTTISFILLQFCLDISEEIPMHLLFVMFFLCQFKFVCASERSEGKIFGLGQKIKSN